MATSAAAGGAVVSQVGSPGGEWELGSPVLQGMTGQQPGESISDFATHVLAVSKLVAKEEQRQADAAAELLRRQQEAAEAQHRQQEAAANAVQRLRQEVAASLHQQELECASTLRGWHFTPTDGHSQPSAEEETKDDISKFIARLLLTCNWQQPELERLKHVIKETRDMHSHTNHSFNACLDNLEDDDAASAHAGPSSSESSTRELEERIDRVVATIGDLGTLASSNDQPTTHNR
ncbi:hypothetical protein CBR_g29375 [Chara braunii]|uniref:Uncharacterized protein n=1 Tax=Chara braunii TaxID=69332 RepID=A0A388JWJ9_CHABU|nr:hypothetical protein CBR_g29375 [Chara braunii]|eukprot:GBG62176.1 hypothetical protein CBR_g29375 [Chara braunii]